MKSATMMLVLGAVLAIATAGPTGALAQNKDQVIKDRQALMKQQGADMGAVKGFIEGNADQAKATAAVTDLTQTMKKLPDVFPPGTEGPSPDGKYTPKAEVWSDWKGFLAARDTGAERAEALLVAVKGGDKAKVQEAFADMGKNGCGGCHGKYRAEIKQ